MPPSGFDWVRVGYDAILVDAYTGQVVQVVRMVFW
jgi:Ni/Co efflux regulator RcnB